MSKKITESQVSMRSEQAKRDIDKLKAELQQLIDAGKNKPAIDDTLLINNRVIQSKNAMLSSQTCNIEDRKVIKKTDLHAYNKPLTNPPHIVKSPKERPKPYDIEATREYMRKQKERRLNSLKSDLKTSEQNVEERKQKLINLHKKTKKLLSKNVQRSRSRSKSKGKDSNNTDVGPDQQKSLHFSRKVANSEVFRLKPDVISNLPCSSKESLFKNVTIRDKSPRSIISENSVPVVIVTLLGSDITKAATSIQAGFRGYKERKRLKELCNKLNSNVVPEPVEEPKLPPKWLETKLFPVPYNVAKTYKRKLAFDAKVIPPTPETESRVNIAVQSSENLLKSKSRVEVKQALKDSVKNSSNKDLKAFLSHKCLDLDLKKVEELNLISKDRLKQQTSLLVANSDSDTSKNIPDISAESGSTILSHAELEEEYSLDINSKRLKELKLRSRNISTNSRHDLNRTFDPEAYKTKRRRQANRLDLKRLKPFQGKEISHRLSSKAVNKSIELNSTIETESQNVSSRNLFTPARIKEILLLTVVDKSQYESSTVNGISANDLSLVKSITNISDRSQSYFDFEKNRANHTLSNSEVELEICANNLNVSNERKEAPPCLQQIDDEILLSIQSKPLSSKKCESQLSRRSDFLNVLAQKESSLSDSIFSTTFESDVSSQRSRKLLSSTANKSPGKALEKDEVLSLKPGEIVTATTNSNQINVKFQAEIHLLNDFNKSLCNLRGIEESLSSLQAQKKRKRAFYQNQNTQTSFISSNKSLSNSPQKVSTDRSMNMLNSSADCSLFNESIFENFEKISKSIKDDTMFNDTVGTKIGDCSSRVEENNASFGESPKLTPISQEALTLQHFEQLIKDEDARRDYLKTIFEVRKDVLLDRAQVNLSILEIKKKHLLETGQLIEASAIRKKQRGILIKLQHEKYEMQRLMQMQKAASKERKNILKEQQNVIKAQLTWNDSNSVSKIKKKHHMGRRSSGPLKAFAPISSSLPHSSHSSTSHRRSDSSVTSRRSSSVAEELIVTTSYHSDSGASVTNVTQEISRKTTIITTAVKEDDGLDESGSVIITEMRNGDDKGNSSLSIDEDLGEKNRKTSMEITDGISGKGDDVGEVGFGQGNALIVNVGQMDYLALSLVESQIDNKRLLLMREDALQKRRKAAEELLDWHQRLLDEEKKVADLEMAARSLIARAPMQTTSTSFASILNPTTEVIWPVKMTVKDADNVIASPNSDFGSVKSIEEQLTTKTNEVQSDCDDSKSTQQLEVTKDSSDSTYSCEFDDQVSLKTVKSSEHDEEDVNILKSQSTLDDIMHNISIISEELSEIYRISSGNSKLNITMDGQLVECQTEEEKVSSKKNVEQSVTDCTTAIPVGFNLEEADILEQNIKLIEMEIEELQSKTLNTLEAGPNPHQNTGISDCENSSQHKSNLIDVDKSISKEETEDAETTISNHLATDSQNEQIEQPEHNVLNLSVFFSEEKTNNSNKHSVDTPSLSFALEESPPTENSVEILSSKAPDIIESLNRNFEENIDSHSSSNMPEILENLNEANVQQAGSSKTTSPSHSSEPSLEEPPLENKSHDDMLSEDFDELSIELPSSEIVEIAVANEDIMKTVRMCTELLDKQGQVENGNEFCDESSKVSDDFNKTYVVHRTQLNEDDESIEEDISYRFSSVEEETPNVIDVTVINDSYKENEIPATEIDRVPSMYCFSEAKISSKDDEDASSSSTNSSNSNSKSKVSDSSNGISSKTGGVSNVKKRVSEIMADAKQKTDKSPRIQDLYTTTYDVGFTEKGSEIVSELDQIDPEYISPKLVEVKAEELELLKKQWAIEQEIKQLEEQQLSEQREQLPYQYLREIPNKPPPPYTPPLNQAPLVTVPSVIPSNITQLLNVVPTISNHLYDSHLNKTLESTVVSEESVSEFNTPEVNELIFDLCKELTEAHYDQFRPLTDDGYTPSWMKSEETLRKPLDKDGLCRYLEEKCIDLFGFKENINVKESSIMRWSRKKRDHVDEVLVRELQADECNWTNYELDELIVTDRLVEDLTDMLLKEVLDELRDFWTAKNT